VDAVFEVRTERFTGTAPRGGVNEDIGGDELAVWLSAQLNENGVSAVDPWPEDHGWDFAVRHDDGVYLIVCSCEFEGGPQPATDFLVQVSLQRSLMDKIMGRRKMDAASDPVVAAVREVLLAQSDMKVFHQAKESSAP
jgi:hypothetical protein